MLLYRQRLRWGSVNGNASILAAASLATHSNGQHGTVIGGSLGCSDFTTAQIYARGNVTAGVQVSGGNFVGSNNSVLRDNGLSGLMLVNGGTANCMGTTFSGNPRALDVSRVSYADAITVTGSATDTAFYADKGGQIIAWAQPSRRRHSRARRSARSATANPS